MLKRERRNSVSIDLRGFARTQRTEPARAEEILWEQVRAGRLKGHKFKRQVPIAPYIVDFLCPAARLIVELDGPHHEKADQQKHDVERDRWLTAQGFTVLRFPNELILTTVQLALDRVLAVIEREDGPSPLAASQPVPSPAEGGGCAPDH